MTRLTYGVLVVSFFVGCSGSSTQKVELAQRGGRGESCQARNDCADGLACIKNVCSQNDFPISVTAKQCDSIDCATKDDCCKSFTVSTYCTTLKSQCDADPTYCPSYQSQCVCQFECKEDKCVTTSTCATDTDCFSGTGRFCVSGQCVSCKADTDCGTGVGGQQHCVTGTCKAGCTKNDECPLFSTCKDGQCAETGCASDRECYGFTKSPLAKCVATKCLVPCETDGECGQFEACNQGSCVFVGCETDDECRYFLNLQSTQTAVCR